MFANMRSSNMTHVEAPKRSSTRPHPPETKLDAALAQPLPPNIFNKEGRLWGSGHHSLGNGCWQIRSSMDCDQPLYEKHKISGLSPWHPINRWLKTKTLETWTNGTSSSLTFVICFFLCHPMARWYLHRVCGFDRHAWLVARCHSNPNTTWYRMRLWSHRITYEQSHRISHDHK